jgi:hypothetical protein
LPGNVNTVPGPSTVIPRTAKAIAAIHVVCSDTSHGPSRVNTGTASKVNAASVASTTSAHPNPIASLCPPP